MTPGDCVRIARMDEARSEGYTGPRRARIRSLVAGRALLAWRRTAEPRPVLSSWVSAGNLVADQPSHLTITRESALADEAAKGGE